MTTRLVPWILAYNEPEEPNISGNGSGILYVNRYLACVDVWVSESAVTVTPIAVYFSLYAFVILPDELISIS